MHMNKFLSNLQGMETFLKMTIPCSMQLALLLAPNLCFHTNLLSGCEEIRKREEETFAAVCAVLEMHLILLSRFFVPSPSFLPSRKNNHHPHVDIT